MLCSLALWACVLSLVDSAKILFHGMHSSRSHLGSMLPLASALARAGHDVHILETSEHSKPSKLPSGITNHFIQLTEDKEQKSLRPLMWTSSFKAHALPTFFGMGDVALQKLMSDHRREMGAIVNRTWDVVFADELFSMSSFGLAILNSRRFNKPYIMFSTTVLVNLFSWEQALGRMFVLRPSMWMASADDIFYDIRRFSHRLAAMYDAVAGGLALKVGCEFWYTKGLRQLGIHDFSFTDLWTNSAFNFQEEINQLAFPMPMSTDVINTGAHCGTAKALPNDLKEFVEQDSNGTIYIAFGTYVKWSSVPKSTFAVFEYFLRSMKGYRIIFAYDGPPIEELPKNVKVLKWAPQYDILTHERTRLFVSHGGLKSVKEAICTETPALYIPMFAEQTHNAAVGIKLGFARSINKLTLNGEKLVRVAREMLTGESYASAARRTKAVFVDRPASGTQEGVFWTERAIRHGGKRPVTFKRRGARIQSTKFFFFDAIGAIACVILLAAGS